MSNKKVVVLGCGRGIGSGLAAALASAMASSISVCKNNRPLIEIPTASFTGSTSKRANFKLNSKSKHQLRK